MNLRSVPLKAVFRNGLYHLSVGSAPKAIQLAVFPARILGAVFRGGVRRSSSSSVLRQNPTDLGASQRIQYITSIGCSRKYSLADFSRDVNSHGIWGQSVRNSTTQASPAADIAEGEKPKANINKTQVSFDELRSLITDGKVMLVDVREPEELQEKGCLPNCVNIPLTKLKAALALNDEEFKQTYSKPKLQKDDPNVVFYGLSSVKSSTAVEIAHKMGFKKSRHYPGGMEEWNQKHPKT